MFIGKLEDERKLGGWGLGRRNSIYKDFEVGKSLVVFRNESRLYWLESEEWGVVVVWDIIMEVVRVWVV